MIEATDPYAWEDPNRGDLFPVDEDLTLDAAPGVIGAEDTPTRSVHHRPSPHVVQVIIAAGRKPAHDPTKPIGSGDN